ncbi:hypothetical protein OFN13_27765, partial [Escherichia coli]|nr:hypothetical protein [Escherichia coli]
MKADNIRHQSGDPDTTYGMRLASSKSRSSCASLMISALGTGSLPRSSLNRLATDWIDTLLVL